MLNIIGIISLIIGLIIHFLPTIIAFRKNTYNKLFILALNLLPNVISIVVGIIIYLTTLKRYNVSITEMPYYMSAASSGSVMVSILPIIVSIISIIIWIIALVKAIRSY